MKEVFANGINQMSCWVIFFYRLLYIFFKQAEELPPIKTLKSSFSLLVLILKLKTTVEEKAESKTRAIKNSNK